MTRGVGRYRNLTVAFWRAPSAVNSGLFVKRSVREPPRQSESVCASRSARDASLRRGGCQRPDGTSDRDDSRTVDFHRDALPEKVDRENENSAVRPATDEDAFDAGQRPFVDPDALTLAQVRVRQNREIRALNPLKRFDFRVGHRGQ